MRIYVKIPDASMICAGEEQFPVKGQLADVPDVLGASLLSFPEYEQYNGQVELHDDFVKYDKEATVAAEQAEKEARTAAEKAQKEAEKTAKKAAEEAAKKEAEEAARIAAEEAAEEDQRKAEEEAARLAEEEARKASEEAAKKQGGVAE